MKEKKLSSAFIQSKSSFPLPSVWSPHCAQHTSTASLHPKSRHYRKLKHRAAPASPLPFFLSFIKQFGMIHVSLSAVHRPAGSCRGPWQCGSACTVMVLLLLPFSQGNLHKCHVKPPPCAVCNELTRETHSSSFRPRPRHTSGMSPLSIGSGSRSSLMWRRERNRLWAASWFICLILLSDSDPTSLQGGTQHGKEKRK